MVSRRHFLCALAALALSSSSRAQARLSLQGTAAQAMPLFLSVLGVGESPGLEMEWEGTRYPLAWLPEQQLWRGVLPISIDCPKKPESGVRVYQGQHLILQREVEVKPKNYGMQYLTLNESTLASYAKPQNKADDRAILDSMKEFDSIQHWKGNFKSPCQAPETTGFGQRRLYNGWKKSWHKGLDLGGYDGQPVQAPAAGRVVHVARGVVNGNTLVLSHGLGVFSVYLHLSDFESKLGDLVDVGQTIAYVGGTGGFAPHLHWEVRAYGVPVHPKAFYQLPADWR